MKKVLFAFLGVACVLLMASGADAWKNGKSPLETAGVSTSGMDWVRLSQGPNSTN